MPEMIDAHAENFAWIIQLGDVTNESGKAAFIKGFLAAGKHQNAELEAVIDIWKKQWSVRTFVEEIQIAGRGMALDELRKEFLRACFRRDARRDKKPDNPAWCNDALCSFHEQRVEISVRRQTGVGNHHPLRAMRLVVSARALAFSNSCASGSPVFCSFAIMVLRSAARDARAISGPSRCEPFDLLQLDAVPRRIADHRIKTASQRFSLPCRPDAGKGDLPV